MPLKVRTTALELSSGLRHQFDEILERHFGHRLIQHSYPTLCPAPIEYYKEGDNLVVEVDVPGMDPKEIEVTISGDVLKVAGEREDNCREKQRDCILTEVRYGHFERSIRVPQGLESDQILASYDRGILKLVIALPKSMKLREVPVQTAAGNEAHGKAATKAA
jgi:HSP20 family protein